jgi:hypothetical protein
VDENVMNDATSPNWKPSPELLAAFADGELDARDDADGLCARIEAWLAANPAAQADLAANRRLKALWDRGAPPAPPAEAWDQVMKRLAHAPAPARRGRSAGFWVGAATAAACVLWALMLANSYRKPPAPALEVFAVAGDNDVEILYVEGDSLDGLVVGFGPFRNVLELPDFGEIVVISVTPSPLDNTKPVFNSEGPPLIWARFDWEEK